jgi:integrase
MLRTLRALARIQNAEIPAELERWVLHDLRHVVRTRMAELRVSDNVAEMVIGHGKRGMSRVYDQHRYEPEMREAAEAWAEMLAGIVVGAPPKVVPLKRRRA